jgi:hypothetical protein
MRAVLMGLAMALSSCVVVTDDVPPTYGQLTLRWTIEGTYDPAYCTAAVASTAAITVYDIHGAYVTQGRASCSAFHWDVTLWPGRYSAAVIMLDAYGHTRSTTAVVPIVDVPTGGSVWVDVEFPWSSFYPTYLRSTRVLSATK